jgi:hypothetical protein
MVLNILIIIGLFGTHFCKNVFMFVKQNLWVPPKKFSVWYIDFNFVLKNNFFFRGSHALFQKGHKLFSLFVFFFFFISF